MHDGVNKTVTETDLKSLLLDIGSQRSCDGRSLDEDNRCYYDKRDVHFVFY